MFSNTDAFLLVKNKRENFTLEFIHFIVAECVAQRLT